MGRKLSPFGRPSEVFEDMEEWLRDINSAFGDFGFDFPSHGGADVYQDEKGENLVYEAEAPGMDKEDLEVSVIPRDNAHYLKIGGEAEKEEEGKYYRRGRRRKISLSERLPEEADPEKITSEYEDGILRVTVPLQEPLEEEKTIDVEIE